MYDYEQRLNAAKEVILDADYILIGGGSGLSAAAGLTYSGKRFTDNFADFIEKYGLEDMYAASFYPFKTDEELWAHWARHIDVNRFSQPATQLYRDLLVLVQDKQYFVLTTNVESQFAKAGFPQEKIFATQGDYAYLQCAKGCHDKLCYNEDLVKQMLRETHNCQIPTTLVPKCPVCGEAMDVNLRHNEFFVQDEAWYEAAKHYETFLKKSTGKRIVYLELGVGFNTPTIIRFPFEQMTYQNPKATLVRINKDYPKGAKENVTRTVAFDEDMAKITEYLLEENHARHLEPMARLCKVQ
ncbi:Sir2 silent information regulator family NAD-dependent deacetylase [Desulfosporosinus fructosivorans]|uniref:Sir2 silent information regulator family NAD-dependent deacetylase n=1 Tax=Desulfosporosinus fructosivorans TaxID=2018669 RepID=A0A4Z0RBI5_9FIRM|nr:Sir2 silent information regulator family NAD-dependent deacetylase [Desulfosporosinus fructosivorans]TGE39363.1 Sir2 silent information regulator family NAD-dependent deacetylase [Desulfosporosinus fructosivorans]